jgi:hypothetical protein
METQSKLHIGHMVKSVFDKSGLSVAEFARRIHCTRPNVYAIFERNDIGVEQLLKISVVLNHNFFDDVVDQSGMKSKMQPKQIVVNLNNIDAQLIDKIIEVLRDSSLLSE